MSKTNETIETLGTALPKEMARVRDEVMPNYLAIGPAGTFGVLMMRHTLDRATKALAEGDLVAMIRAYEDLKEIED
jgi:hypothetical protein